MGETMLLRGLLAIVTVLSGLLACWPLVRLWQAQRFSLRGYFRALKGSPGVWLPWMIIWILLGVGASFLTLAMPWLSAFIACMALWILVIAAWTSHKLLPEPVTVKPPAARLLILLVFLLYAQFELLVPLAPDAGVGVLFIPLALAALETTLAAVIMMPLEGAAQAAVMRSAGKKIRSMPGLTVIGITGSAGKTGAGKLLEDMLAARYAVLSAPDDADNGAPWIICRQLVRTHRVLLVEMRPDRRGYMKKMRRMARPKLGVITAVGAASHMSEAQVAAGSYEMIEAMDELGTAFFPSGSGYADMLYRRCPLEKVRFGLENDGVCDITAENLRLSGRGGSFTLTDRRSGESVHCRTRLLGRHNIRSILAAAAVARKMGIDLATIAKCAEEAEPRGHFLHVEAGSEGRTLLLDGSAAAPEGFMAALEVLRLFYTRKVVVVQVAGAFEDAGAREKLMKSVAETADLVILCGLVGRALWKRGLTRAGLDAGKILEVPALSGLRAHLDELTEPGDTVLIESADAW
jgi:UDP-N-acetylmuramoyl-tripeptide--D-alanyl-D-alanine ligase